MRRNMHNVRQKVAQIAVLSSAVIGSIATGVAINRWRRAEGDYVPNVDGNLFRQYLEQQRKQGNETVAPWVTTDTQTLQQLKHTPEIVIPNSMQMLTSTVAIKPLSACPYKNNEDAKTIKNVVVGGAPAAMVAMQTAIDGEPGLYVNFTKNSIAISDGSAFHGEPQRVAEAAAYESGSTPLKFFRDEIKALASPPRYSKEVVQPNLRWKKLDWNAWLMHPEQWFAGIELAIKNQLLALKYEKAKKEGISTGTENLTDEIQKSGEYIKQLDKYLGGTIIQSGRDSLWVTRTDADEKAAEHDAAALKKEACQLIKLTADQVKQEFGFVPSNAKGYWKKVGDFSFKKDFMIHLTKAISEHGYEVHNDWQLREVYADQTQQGGWAVFVEETSAGEKIHPRKFSNMFISLGVATYTDSPTPLASVAGVSCQGVINGVELLAGKSLVFGDTNHVTPLSDTKDGPVDVKTGKPQRLTPVQYTNSARVKPREMGNKWADFDARYALHLDESIRKALPKDAEFNVVSCRACPRIIGPEGILTWHQYGSMWRQMGPGGGGLTQAGRMARQVAKNSANPIPDAPVPLSTAPSVI